MEEQITITMQCLHGFYTRARKQYMDGRLIENTLFYYWLRVSTMKERVAEAIFQKIERNWEEACKRKDEEMAAFSGVR
ncbi:MAG: hypothetical protein HC888_06690 [Candidatus Competibacteraceae bacterium]|nr:hypothetical protein [Candidatus Competibacteraceae bacterium]